MNCQNFKMSFKIYMLWGLPLCSYHLHHSNGLQVIEKGNTPCIIEALFKKTFDHSRHNRDGDEHGEETLD